MAIIHEERHNGRIYQIRTAGASVRLYTNGVFHSQYNPNRRLTGSVWDLLTVPAYLIDPVHFKTVLVLGVGGGAVLRMIDNLFPRTEMTGVELDPVHLKLGRRYFGLDCCQVNLVAADALTWVKENPSLRFDLVIDDLFADENGVAQRAFTHDKSWFKRVGALVSKQGVLVTNFADVREFRHSAIGSLRTFGPHWSSGYSLRLDTLENVVSVLCRAPNNRSEFQSTVKEQFGANIATRFNIRNVPTDRQLNARRGRGAIG